MIWSLGYSAASPDGQPSFDGGATRHKGGQNLSRFSNKEFDSIYDQIRVIPTVPSVNICSLKANACCRVCAISVSRASDTHRPRLAVGQGYRRPPYWLLVAVRRYHVGGAGESDSVSRRDFLRASGAVGAFAALPKSVIASPQMAEGFSLGVPDRGDRFRSGTNLRPLFTNHLPQHIRRLADVRLSRAAGQAETERHEAHAGSFGRFSDLHVPAQTKHFLCRRRCIQRRAARAHCRRLRVLVQAAFSIRAGRVLRTPLWSRGNRRHRRSEKGALKTGRFDYDRPIEGLRALDRYTFQLLLGKPNPRFIYQLADSAFLERSRARWLRCTAIRSWRIRSAQVRSSSAIGGARHASCWTAIQLIETSSTTPSRPPTIPVHRRSSQH